MQRRPKTLTLLATGFLVVGATAIRAADTPASQDPPFKHYIGYHGPDGTQVYPNSKPPTKWDGARGENILWQTPMPFVGYGGPIVVGNRVFVMSEPGYKSDFPVLACLDADSGKPLWQQEINHLEIAIPDEAKRAQVAKAWNEHLAYHRLRNSLDMRNQFVNIGYGWGVRNKVYAENLAKLEELKPAPGQSYPEYNLEIELIWEGGANRNGITGATPCSDGQRVFVATGWRQFACFDQEGKRQWLRWIPEASAGDYHGAGGWRSPVAWNDPAGNGAGLFIADSHGFVRAFDKKTGATRWEVSRQALGITMANGLSPKIFRVGDTDLLWCAGPMAIRLADGKPLAIEGWKNGGTLVAVDPARPDTVYLTGGGHDGGWEGNGRGPNPPPAAVRFALERDTLKATVLWSGLGGVPSAWNHSVLAVNDGKVYFSNWLSYMDCHSAYAILDAATGKVLQGALNPQGLYSSPPATPPTSQAYAITGGHIYGIGTGGPLGCKLQQEDRKAPPVTMEVYTLEGKRQASNTLYGPPLEGEIEQRLAGAAVMNRFSYLMPFTIGGDRIYVRGNHYLYCIGEKK